MRSKHLFAEVVTPLNPVGGMLKLCGVCGPARSNFAQPRLLVPGANIKSSPSRNGRENAS